MCGIAGIIVKKAGSVNAGETVARMSALIRHRGPDGEGFAAACDSVVTPYFGSVTQDYLRTDLNYIPKTNLAACPPHAFLAFAHRRLAILDLTDTGHQPMCSGDKDLWITFNGEIYNYIELRSELKSLGHSFISESDTEVILQAYKQWGTACVERFNGMWSFCIYDTGRNICFASRDRLGVKPFYYINNGTIFAFASEQKAFTGSGLVKPRIHAKALHSYLINDLLETEPSNFFEGITELWPGTNLVYNLNTKELKLQSYFHLENNISLENDSLVEKELVEKINRTLEQAVRLRLRSDVEVGTCLSGGIDSSVLAVIMSALTRQPVHCFTSVFRGRPINEEEYADLVAKKINGRQAKTEPTLEGFLKEADGLIYSQDVPIWSTSTYAQYKVMELAKQNGIKVVLDGQGADELFGGYHHHFIAKWNGLLKQGRFLEAIAEMNAAGKSIPSPYIFFLKERLKQRNTFYGKHFSLLFHDKFIGSYDMKAPATGFSDLNRQLLSDIYDTRLKIFLKCEDRCGMWHSVESRTPFSDDIELMKLMFSFDANKKIKNGVSKYLLREATKDRLPERIYKRYDKKGFETPMQDWMVAMRPTLLTEIKNADFDFVNKANLDRTNPHNTFHNKLLFKLFVLARWQKVFY